jgi:hypothetical protein
MVAAAVSAGVAVTGLGNAVEVAGAEGSAGTGSTFVASVAAGVELARRTSICGRATS